MPDPKRNDECPFGKKTYKESMVDDMFPGGQYARNLRERHTLDATLVKGLKLKSKLTTPCKTCKGKGWVSMTKPCYACRP